MRKKRHIDPNDPIRDFIDLQQNRYSEGYWLTEWYKKGRYDPYYKEITNNHYSSLVRALLVLPVPAAFVASILNLYNRPMPFPWGWFVASLIPIFLALWYLLHRSMLRAFGSEPYESTEQKKNPHDGKHT
jgi:hypothetical protein